MARQLNLRSETTWRNSTVYHVDSRHVSLEKLKGRLEDLQLFEIMDGKKMNILTYLKQKIIPNYPKPEFRVRRLKHETTFNGLCGIQDSGGFRGIEKGEEVCLLWWSLLVGPDQLRAAEGQGANQEIPLWKFATSPSFTETSSLGSFRFTFTVQEVLDRYREQICSGQEPVMRVYRTSLFPQKVQYTILIHSPVHNNTFFEYPLLKDEPNPVCSYRHRRFIWRSQAMCGTHRYKFTYDGQVKTCGRFPKFYVYDSVAIALHMEGPQVLHFDQDHLRNNLKFCHRSPVASASKFNDIFTSPEKAEGEVRGLWPHYEGNLEEECSLQELLAVPKLRLVLLGRSGADMSRSADLILDTKTFTKVFKQSEGPSYWRESREVLNRFVTVLDTHQFSQWNSQNENITYFKKEASRADAILLVISESDVDGLKNKVERLLGEAVWRSIILLFFSARIESPEPELQELVDTVDRTHVMSSPFQVQTLLEMVEEMKNRVDE